jgi:hypothetical protein
MIGRQKANMPAPRQHFPTKELHGLTPTRLSFENSTTLSWMSFSIVSMMVTPRGPEASLVEREGQS